MLHGWPGSVREFYNIIPLLTAPREGHYDFVFELIVPSLPGYGFSQAAVRPGLGAAQIALLFKNFMGKLGFRQFYGQGGDFGAIILQHLFTLYPEVGLGFHSNFCMVNTPLALLKLMLGIYYPEGIVRPDHIDRMYPLSRQLSDLVLESGYFHIQATKPDTIGSNI